MKMGTQIAAHFFGIIRAEGIAVMGKTLYSHRRSAAQHSGIEGVTYANDAGVELPFIGKSGIE